MKSMRIAAAAIVALGLGISVAQAGDVSIKGVHLCCGACVRDADAALKDLKGISGVAVDRNTKVIFFKAETPEAATEAIEALADAGFHGSATHDKKELAFPESGAEKGAKASVITVTGVHLCCGACVTGAKEALESVEGATTIDIDRTGRSIKISGKDVDVTAAIAALNKGGFHGTVEKKK